MTYAICRDHREGESFPYLDTASGISYWARGECLHYPCDETKYECWMPESIEYNEFNIVILLHGQPVLVRSIHFDFESKQTKGE